MTGLFWDKFYQSDDGDTDKDPLKHGKHRLLPNRIKHFFRSLAAEVNESDFAIKEEDTLSLVGNFMFSKWLVPILTEESGPRGLISVLYLDEVTNQNLSIVKAAIETMVNFSEKTPISGTLPKILSEVVEERKPQV